MSRPAAGPRLARLLAMVPWIVAQDGPLLSEVCQRFELTEKELLDDLNLLFMCGVYPFTPDALIEVDIDDGRVWVRCADWFRRPLRLTPPEGLALLAAARAMLELQPGSSYNDQARPAIGGQNNGSPNKAGLGDAGPHGGAPETHGGAPETHSGAPDRGSRPNALARAAAKLESVLGPDGGPSLEVELGQADPAIMALLQDAVRQEQKVELDYYSFGRDEFSRRVVQPWKLFSSEGSWYLLAFCETVGGRRLFRVDRARGASLLPEHFKGPEGLGPVPTYDPGPDDPVVVLTLAPAARWVIERYPVEQVLEIPGGRAQVTMKVSSDAWLERLLLRGGPDIEVVAGAAEAGPRAAMRLLARYRHVSSEEWH